MGAVRQLGAVRRGRQPEIVAALGWTDLEQDDQATVRPNAVEAVGRRVDGTRHPTGRGVHETRHLAARPATAPSAHGRAPLNEGWPPPSRMTESAVRAGSGPGSARQHDRQAAADHLAALLEKSGPARMVLLRHHPA